MKFAKMVGLVAILATALTAMLGTGSASAEPLTETVLCKSSTSSPYCSSSNRYPAKTAISASSGSVTIKTPFANVVCGESAITGQTTAEAGEPLPISVSAWTLGGCKAGGEECTVTPVKSAPYSGSLSRTTENSGTLSIHSGGSGNPGWTVVCSGLLSCTYTMEPGFTVQSSGNTPALNATEVQLARSGVLCGKWAKFTGTYTVSSPYPSYLAVPKEAPASATAFCHVFSQYYCEPGNLATNLEGETSSLVINNPSNYGGGDFSCEQAMMVANPTASYGEPLPMKVSLTVFNCHSAGLGSGCTASASFPKGGGVTRENGDGLWSGLEMQFQLDCGSFVHCTYTLPPGETGMVLHGNPGTIEWNDATMTVSGGLCPSTATLEGASFPLPGAGALLVTDAFH